MSKIKIAPDPAGTGTFTIEAPSSSTDRTVTLPDDNINLGNVVQSTVSGKQIEAGSIPRFPIENLSAWEAQSPQPTQGWYWIKPPGASEAFFCEYSGYDYKSTGYGFWRWWRCNDDYHSILNHHYNKGYQWNLLMIEKENTGTWQTAGFDTNQTFNQRNTETTTTIGTRVGYRVFFGYAGGHGIYTTGQTPCSWGSSTNAIGAGFNGSNCGSFPDNLYMGTGTSGNTYGGRGGVWSFWFRWLDS